MLTTHNNIPTEQINLNRLIFLLELEALQGIKLWQTVNGEWLKLYFKRMHTFAVLKAKCA